MSRALQLKKEKDILIYTCCCMLISGLLLLVIVLFVLPLPIWFILTIFLFGRTWIYIENKYSKLALKERILESDVDKIIDPSVLLLDLDIFLMEGNPVNLYYDKYREIYQMITNDDLYEGKTLEEVLEKLK